MCVLRENVEGSALKLPPRGMIPLGTLNMARNARLNNNYFYPSGALRRNMGILKGIMPFQQSR